MKLSYAWLKKYLADLDLTVEQAADQLTSLGLEVDSISPVASDFNKVVVGQITETKPHPDADRLQLCSVDIGASEPLAIVCGAKNARPNIKVAVALVGARLSAEFKIKKSKIRGQESFGMLCSGQELGLASKSSGIIELDENAQLGNDLREYLNLDDYVLDVDLTPNRGDCASVLGLARELAAVNEQSLAMDDLPEIVADSNLTVSARVNAAATAAAPVFLLQTAEDLDLSAPLPLQWQERLRRSGMRAVNPLVDILNIVMLEYGVPMHAYNLSAIDGDLQVDFAQAGEQLTLLDGKTYTLQANDLTVRDQKQAHALAGVMGGQASEVSLSTTKVVLEAAYFDPLVIAKTARTHNLHSEASYRFERGVDSQRQLAALQLSASMLKRYQASIKFGTATTLKAENELPKPASINLRSKQIKRILGLDLNEAWIEQALSNLGMKIKANSPTAEDKDAQSWQVQVPSWRFDLVAEYDLMQELLRCYGYHKLPEVTLQWQQKITAPQTLRSANTHAMRMFADLGYQQIRSYSFVSAEKNDLFSPGAIVKKIANPLAKDQAVMRTSLWPGLITAVQYNLDRQQKRLRLFEVAACFTVDKSGAVTEQQHFAAAITGGRLPEQWADKDTASDFYDLKSALQRLLSLYLKADELEISRAVFTAAKHAALHPGQTAAINYAGKQLGYIGKLHPQAADSLGIKANLADIFLFEINVDLLPQPQPTVYHPASRFPTMRRDLAFLVPMELTAAELLQEIEKIAASELADIQLSILPFDEYRQSNVDTLPKSIALGLTFQSTSRTLIEEEINKFIQHVVENLQRSMGLQLRG